MISPPPTPLPELPRNTKDWRFEHNGAPCEWVEEYRPGGLHPIDLGDTLCEDKYKVIRKLGAGSFSTVWLASCESEPKYVALKVMDAHSSTTPTELAMLEQLATAGEEDSNSRHITKLLGHFKLEGPNGVHQCLVLEVMASTAASLVEELPENRPMRLGKTQRYPKWMAKKLLLHALRGLAFLHQNGIVHADVQPGNLLFSIKDISGLEPQQLEQNEAGTARPIRRIDGKLDRWAPKNLYLNQSLHEYVQLDQTFCVNLSDFGAAFYTSDPPSKNVTPLALRAPEIILKQKLGTGIDIWSFGCLMYEFLTGEALFAVMVLGYDQEDRDDADDEHLCQMNDIIRPLPESMMRAWPRGSKYFDADHNHLQPDEDCQDDNGEADTGKSGEENEHENEDEAEGNESYIYDTLEQRFAEHKHPDIDEEEADVVSRLIREILVYDPAQRPSAEELLKHPWFSE